MKSFKLNIKNTVDAEKTFVDENYITDVLHKSPDINGKDLVELAKKDIYMLTNGVPSGLFKLPPFVNTSLTGSAEDGGEFFGQYYEDRIISFTFNVVNVTQMINGAIFSTIHRLNEALEQWDELMDMTITIDEGEDTERYFKTKVSKSENTDLDSGYLEFIEFNHGLFWYSDVEYQTLTGATGATIEIYSKYENVPIDIEIMSPYSQFGLKNLTNRQEFFIKDNNAYGFTAYYVDSFTNTAGGYSEEDEMYIDLVSNGDMKGTFITLQRGWNTLQVTNRITPISMDIGTRKSVRMCF